MLSHCDAAPLDADELHWAWIRMLSLHMRSVSMLAPNPPDAQQIASGKFIPVAGHLSSGP